ncbi:MAG: hypothetical protein AVDCRST_MAG93-5770 [uncultured Chloroflexia bacterium]|uniref:Uncharacterized protein n=1 Tax=uncultured Chloroflexia bacterium TaxID=1672391 RepID=A0A6J4L2Y4_9CHLR|nr:MAG: hypothetical protein AVDCRST_MAG93-5770 [uncultured Chloroflexia bacterium]
MTTLPQPPQLEVLSSVGARKRYLAQNDLRNKNAFATN